MRKLKQVHISGTCQWFLKSPLYLKWRDLSSNSRASDFMWIQGKPGSGKSVLASQIIRDLHSCGGSVVLYIFCKNGEENRDTLESILRNLIFEMLEWSPQKQAFHRLLLNARLNEKSQYALSVEVLWNLLTQMISEVEIMHCVIDGLDECHSSKSNRVSFLSRLVEVFIQRAPRAKLVLISQLHLSESGDHSSFWMDFSIQPSSVRGDIELLALTRIGGSKVLNTHPEKDNLLKQLVARSNGMLLWTELMIKELEAGHWNVTNVLEKPPEGLFEMWRSILERISHSRLGTEKISHTLQLLLAAARPLSHEELALALAVSHGLCQHEDYDSRGDAIAEGRLIVQELSPLLTSMPDDTVQLAHSSLKDYLFYPDTPSASTFSYFNGKDAHARMSSVLITYMSFQSFKSALTGQLQPKYFLLEYATRWLVYHPTRTGVSTQTADILVTFFNTVQGWKWLQRLQETFGISFGHLQLLQSDMASWAESSCFSDKSVYTLSNFLLILAQSRHEIMKSLPNDDLLLLNSMHNLAATFGYQGRWKEAEELQVQVVELHNRALGAEHPDTLISMHNLAWTFDSQGRYKESEKLNKQILEASTRVLGAEHPQTIRSMHNLATTFCGQDRLKEAEEMQVRALRIRERVLGAEHQNTLSSLHNLAWTFNSQGRYKESEELNMKILETSTRVLGAEHPQTLMSMHNPAGQLGNQKRWKEAEDLHGQILEMRTKVLGAEHPDTLMGMHSLAWVFNSQGRYKESEKLNMQILETRMRVLGAEHPHTLMSMHNLAGIFGDQERWKEAEELYLPVLETRTKVLGAEHPATLMSMHNLAITFDRQGRYKESEQLNMQILEMSTRVLGAEHPETLTSMSNLAWNYHALGRRNEAIELMAKVVDLRSKRVGPDHPHTLSSTFFLDEWSST